MTDQTNQTTYEKFDALTEGTERLITSTAAAYATGNDEIVKVVMEGIVDYLSGLDKEGNAMVASIAIEIAGRVLNELNKTNNDD